MDYNIDFKKLVTLSLGGVKRKPWRARWLWRLLSYFEVIHEDFVQHANTTKEDISWNGQKILLERYLNLKFGDGIYIQNTDAANEVILLADAPFEINPLLSDAPEFDNPVVGDSALGTVNVSGFTVYVPAALNADLNQVRAFVNFYKIGSSSFDVTEI